MLIMFYGSRERQCTQWTFASFNAIWRRVAYFASSLLAMLKSTAASRFQERKDLRKFSDSPIQNRRFVTPEAVLRLNVRISPISRRHLFMRQK